MINNGEIVKFLKQRDYIMINNALGAGSFGKTVLLQDPFIDELFVAKKYDPDTDEVEQKERFFKNFLDEIKILYKLNHPNIVRIYSYHPYEREHTGFIIMEYIDGQDIGTFISNLDFDFEDGLLDDIFNQLLDGFLYIENNGIIHRDIREGNIMINKSGKVKIIDFGIGKVVEKGEKEADSLANDVNRFTVPNEYYDGIYTTKTDIFYLGELFKRLLVNNENIWFSDFSHFEVLEKMMQKKPDDRYASFSDVKEAIMKKDFKHMSIADADKDIYLGFANHLYSALSNYIDEQKFNRDPIHFITKMETALQNNCFEHYVQSNAELLRGIVIGGYRYKPNVLLSCSDLQKFLDWYKSTTKETQRLILNNIIIKLSTIRTEASEPDLPF